MKKPFLLILILLTGSILCCGCNSYAEPELSLNTTISQAGVSEQDHTISYDVMVDVTNTGSNNAYDVMVMVILSTPKDLPEYRFVNENIEIGTVPKHETISSTRRLSLAMTPANYNLLFSGERKPEYETKVIRVSSNIMG